MQKTETFLLWGGGGLLCEYFYTKCSKWDFCHTKFEVNWKMHFWDNITWAKHSRWQKLTLIPNVCLHVGTRLLLQETGGWQGCFFSFTVSWVLELKYSVMCCIPNTIDLIFCCCMTTLIPKTFFLKIWSGLSINCCHPSVLTKKSFTCLYLGVKFQGLC